MLTEAQIKKFSLGFEFTSSAYPGLEKAITIAKNLGFSEVKFLRTRQGTYTPNNDYLYLQQNIPADEAPNFIFILSPDVMNVTVVAGQSNMIAAVPFHKMFLHLQPAASPYKINSIYFEGRTWAQAPHPMTQNVPIDYFAVMGQAVIG